MRPVTRRPIVVLLLALLAPLALPGPALGWDRLGHQVVARIAWEHMTGAARRAAVEALRAAPEDTRIAELAPVGKLPEAARARLLFLRAATWPDRIKDEEHPAHRYDRGPWHYVNLFWTEEEGEAVFVDRPPLGEAVHRLEHYRCVLGWRADDERRLGLHLAWLLHVAADVHQPLHASGRITGREPEGDRGGNDFLLDQEENLHAFWDEILGRALPAEREATDTLRERVDRVAERLMERHPREELADRIDIADPWAWARESADIARTRVYREGLERGEDPGDAYRRHAFELAAERAALAGYRIAAWLNETLDPDA